jgi:hypothetical protein
MAGFSDYTAQATINYWMLGTAMPAVAGRYLALFTADPKDDNSGAANEVAGAWYARQTIDSWTAPGDFPGDYWQQRHGDSLRYLRRSHWRQFAVVRLPADVPYFERL